MLLVLCCFTPGALADVAVDACGGDGDHWGEGQRWGWGPTDAMVERQVGEDARDGHDPQFGETLWLFLCHLWCLQCCCCRWVLI